jgi:beta-glucanase (GH16 family)
MRCTLLAVTFALLLIPSRASAELLKAWEFNSPSELSNDWLNGYWWGNSYGPSDPASQHRAVWANNSVSGGMLRQTARYEPGADQWGVQRAYTTGTIRSKQEFTSFYVEARQRFPNGNGMWPALWFLSANSDTEFDVNEYVPYSQRNGVTRAVHISGHHWVRDEVYNFDASAEFHTYGMWVRPGRVDFYLDGELTSSHQHSSILGTRPVHAIIGLAVGGVPEWTGSAPINGADQVYEIDFVRIYDTRPVPEPVTLAPVGLVLAGLLRRRRR